MADRYWVGGTGNWNNSNTSNWSATSGGASGASVPTASDNVIFNANSNTGTNPFTVTMANTPRVCNNFTASGLDGTMTLAGASIGLTVSGNLTFQATNFTRTYTGTTTFNATTTGKTVTTNGVAFNGDVTFNGVGGGWTLGSALNTGGNPLTVTNGTFSTSASNYAVTANIFSSNNSNVRTINLNTSTVTLSSNATAWNMATSTNATLNAGASIINLNNTSPNFAGGGLTYNEVSFTSTALTTPSITGANTIADLTITGRTTIGIGKLSLGADQTITSFTVNGGTASAYRIMVLSSVFGTTRTLTCAAVSLTDVDFQDITGAGVASPFTGTRIGDCGGNTGLTFTTPRTHYFAQTGSANWGATGTGSWASTSGGATNANRFPLAQDTAVFPAATYPASGSTTTINADYNIGTIDMSLRTSNTMTLATGTTTPSIYGNWTNGTGIDLQGTGTLTFAGRTTQQITGAGVSFVQPVNIDAIGGTIQIVSMHIENLLTLNHGTLDVATYGGVNPVLYVYSFNSSNTNTRAIVLDITAIHVLAFTATTVWNTAITTNMTITSIDADYHIFIIPYVTGFTVNTGNLPEIYALNFFIGNSAGVSCTFLANAGNTAKNIIIGDGVTINAIGACTIFGNVLLSSTASFTASSNAMTFGATSGTKTITTNAVPLDFPITFNGVGGTFQLQDALTMGATRTATLANGTLDLNGKTLTVGTAFTTATGTKNLTFNGGTLVCPTASTTAFNNAVPTNFTTTAGTGTGTISMTAATAKTFVGGGSTFNCTLNQGGAGALTITGSNTFSNITNTVQPASVLFTAATTSTFTNFNLSGTSGNLITIGSVTAASHTLSKASGTVSSDFLSISRSTATGGAGWYAGANSTDGGNNSGWIFTAPPSATATGNFLVFF